MSRNLENSDGTVYWLELYIAVQFKSSRRPHEPPLLCAGLGTCSYTTRLSNGRGRVEIYTWGPQTARANTYAVIISPNGPGSQKAGTSLEMRVGPSFGDVGNYASMCFV